MKNFLLTLVQVAVRLVFGVAVLVLLLGLLALGLVLALVAGLVALVTRRKPRWGVHFQSQAQAWGTQAWRRYGQGGRRAAAPRGEVVDAEVREIR
jgi:hypothetical protein